NSTSTSNLTTTDTIIPSSGFELGCPNPCRIRDPSPSAHPQTTGYRIRNKNYRPGLPLPALRSHSYPLADILRPKTTAHRLRSSIAQHPRGRRSCSNDHAPPRLTAGKSRPLGGE